MMEKLHISDPKTEKKRIKSTEKRAVNLMMKNVIIIHYFAKIKMFNKILFSEPMHFYIIKCVKEGIACIEACIIISM